MAAKRASKKRPGGSLLDLSWEWPPHQLMMVHDRHPAVWILGYKMQEVVGEASYVEQLQTVVQRLAQRGLVRLDPTEKKCLAACTAWLTPEPSNEVDPNATAIYCEGLKVGYFSTEANQRWSVVVRRLAAHYQRPVACQAIIVGQFAGQLGVWMMLDTAIDKEGFSAAFALGGDDMTF